MCALNHRVRTSAKRMLRLTADFDQCRSSAGWFAVGSETCRSPATVWRDPAHVDEAKILAAVNAGADCEE